MFNLIHPHPSSLHITKLVQHQSVRNFQAMRKEISLDTNENIIIIASARCCELSPDSTATCIIIQHPQTMLPCNVTCWLRYFADYTFQFYGAARFVKLIWRLHTALIYDFDFRYCGKKREREIFSFQLVKKIFVCACEWDLANIAKAWTDGCEVKPAPEREIVREKSLKWRRMHGGVRET